MLRKTFVLSLLLMFVPLASVSAEPAVNVPLIRVGLLSNQANIIVSAEADFKIINTTNDTVLGEYKTGEKVAVSIKKGIITLNGNPIVASKLAISANGNNGQLPEVNRKHYRGTISLHPTHGKTGLTAVNTLSIEEYLYGVLPREISPDWPTESLKAQAVAARTYALYSLNKFQDDGYDVNTSTDCQVYGGRDCEDPRSNAVVNDTAGQVLLYQGKLIAAFFHSSGGGYTEDSENVWGGSIPYLRGVADFDQKSPQYRWQKELKPKDLEDALRSAGYEIGELQAIELSPLSKQPVNSADRGVSGRVKNIRFIGSTGSTLISGIKLRTILGLNSTLFDIKIVFPNEKYFDVDIVNTYGQLDIKRVDMNLPPFKAGKLPTDKPETSRLSGQADEVILITGYGWGHGLGLSQWGAKAMAAKAPAGDTAYYKEILKHYYSGVDIQKSY